MFSDAGVPVHDSDEVVHRLYAGKAAPLIEKAFPGCTRDGVVDRVSLGKKVLGNPEALKRLEAIVHPLVRADADAFLERHRRSGARIAVLDIPLLFETDGRDRVNKVVVVTASPAIQRERVLSRPGMTAEKFESILAKQVPDSEKRKRADYVIDTDEGLEAARTAVKRIIEDLCH
jgi:dephospho-CoA kinase